MGSGGARPGSGRKKLPENEKKSRKPTLVISVTREQQKSIKGKAESEGKSLSAYIIDLVEKDLDAN